MRILVTGSREVTDISLVDDALRAAQRLLCSPERVTLVHGGARGLDQLADRAARNLWWLTEEHPAQWSQHGGCWCKDWGKRCGFAGHRRNAEMIALGANVVLAFPMHAQNDTSGSRGTWNCAETARDAGLPVLVVWGGRLFPFGDTAVRHVHEFTESSQAGLGSRGELSIREITVTESVGI